MSSNSNAPRVLVVDDEADQRDSLALLLEMRGFAADTAENGLVALDKLHGEQHYDIVLLDLMMPVMDGLTFWGAMSRDTSLAHIPVIVISGVAQFDAAKSIGAAAHLRKPVDLAELYRALEQHCP